MISLPSLALRRTVVAHLIADPAVTALVSAERIFGERSEDGAWPFIRCDGFDGEGLETLGGAVHVFSKEEFTDEAWRIVERVGISLGGAVLTLDEDAARKAHVRLMRTRVIPDGGVAGAWHGIATIEVTIPNTCTA